MLYLYWKLVSNNSTSQSGAQRKSTKQTFSYKSYKYIEMTFTKTLSRQKHIQNICTKANKLITILLKLSKTIPKIVFLRLYFAYICSTLE